MVDDGDLSSDLRRHVIDVDVQLADSLDSVFSLKTEFVQAMKAGGYWQSIIARIKDEYAEHLLAADDIAKPNAGSSAGEEESGDDDDDEEQQLDTCEVIAGTMNEQQFIECLRSIDVSNAVFAKCLFRTFDQDKSGAWSRGPGVQLGTPAAVPPANWCPIFASRTTQGRSKSASSLITSRSCTRDPARRRSNFCTRSTAAETRAALPSRRCGFSFARTSQKLRECAGISEVRSIAS